jgi:CRISPR/Cas system-associated exonuclease Cas4 (RecB family)
MAHSAYILDGVPIPSVTEVISVIDKPFLRFWYAKNGLKECERIKKESGDLGSRVHDAIERYLKGENYDIGSPKEDAMVRRFIDWRETNDFRPVELELKVINRTHRYHGTFDAIGTFGDSTELVMCDWKTSSSINDEYALQLAAYAAAYEEQTGMGITRGLIVRMDKKDNAKKPFEVKEFKNLPRYFDTKKEAA